MAARMQLSGVEAGCPQAADGPRRSACLGGGPENVFSVLRAAELDAFEGLARPVGLGGGDLLFSESDFAHSVYTVISGMLRLSKSLPDGRRQVVGFCFPGDFLGLSMTDRCGLTATAVERVRLCALPRREFVRLLRASPALLARLHGFTTYELELAREQLLLLGRQTAEERVASFLLSMRERWRRLGQDEAVVPLPMTRKDIGDYLGLTVETVSRVLGRFARTGRIVLEPHAVRLVKPDELAAMRLLRGI